jgi:hypothetical protein
MSKIERGCRVEAWNYELPGRRLERNTPRGFEERERRGQRNLDPSQYGEEQQIHQDE